MGNRRSNKEAGIRLIGALLVLLAMAWVFLPAVRIWMVAAIALAVVTGAALLVADLLKARRSAQSPPAAFSKPVPVEGRNVPPSPPSKAPESMPLTHEAVLSALRRIDWFQFEKVVAAIYRSYGDSVERLGGAQPDGGVDLIVTATTGRFVVQCKHWLTWTVGVKNIRELLGTLTTSDIPKGVFVTMHGYSSEARDLGVKHGLVLLDESQLAELIVGLGPQHGAEVIGILNDPRKFCPKCESQMVVRTAKRGAKAGQQFWGCPNYPRCDGTLEAKQV